MWDKVLGAGDARTLLRNLVQLHMFILGPRTKTPSSSMFAREEAVVPFRWFIGPRILQLVFWMVGREEGFLLQDGGQGMSSHVAWKSTFTHPCRGITWCWEGCRSYLRLPCWLL